MDSVSPGGTTPQDPPAHHPLGPAQGPAVAAGAGLAAAPPGVARSADLGTTPQDPPGRRTPWLIPGGLLLILVFLTVNVLVGGPMVAADQRIRAAVLPEATSAAWRWLSDGWHSPAQLLTDLGNYQVAVPVLVACALFVAARHRTLRPLLAALTAIVLLLVTVTSGKILIGRPGPGLATLGAGGLGVFPSGHTTTAAVCFGTAVALLVPDLPARARQGAIALAAAVWLLVGAALVWCDYHWFTDVVAGWALAGLIVPGAVRLSRHPLPRPARGRG